MIGLALSMILGFLAGMGVMALANRRAVRVHEISGRFLFAFPVDATREEVERVKSYLDWEAL